MTSPAACSSPPSPGADEVGVPPSPVAGATSGVREEASGDEREGTGLPPGVAGAARLMVAAGGIM